MIMPPWKVSGEHSKNELVYHQRYVTREQAIREITEYIEIFYNRQRRQARLGYLSPVAYGQQFYREICDIILLVSTIDIRKV